MSDLLPDSPIIAIPFCPTCEPARDTLGEVLDVRWCPEHQPPWGGLEDAHANPLGLGLISGAAEAGGDENRRWCELFARKKTLLRGGGA